MSLFNSSCHKLLSSNSSTSLSAHPKRNHIPTSEIFIYISATCLFFVGSHFWSPTPPDLVKEPCSSKLRHIFHQARCSLRTSSSCKQARSMASMGAFAWVAPETGWDHKTMEMYNRYTLCTWPGILLYLVYISGRPLTQNKEKTMHFPMNYVRS